MLRSKSIIPERRRQIGHILCSAAANRLIVKWKKERKSGIRVLMRSVCFVLAVCFLFSAAAAAAEPEESRPAAGAGQTAEPEVYSAAPESADTTDSAEGLQERTADGNIAISALTFPDATFREYVKSAFDTDKNGVLSQAECGKVTRISCAGRNISSLEGIGYFPNLDSLYCDRNNIHAIDLSANPKVTYLSFQQNPVTDLNISACTDLQTLDMMTTSLTGADLTPFRNLADLTAGRQPLTELNISENTRLQYLTVMEAEIRSLDIDTAPDIEMLMIAGTWITSLHLGSKPHLPFLIVPDNYLATLDLREAPVCSWLQAAGNRLISVHGCPDTEYAVTDFSDQAVYEAAVSKDNGTFDFSAIDPDFAQGQITNLSKGRFDGSVLSGIDPDDTVTYTYTDGGLSVDAAVHFSEGNYWLLGLSIHGWEVGQVPNAPIAESRYGTPVFTYGRPGGTFSSEPPEEAGTWIVRAEVPGTGSYGPLSAEALFEITEPSVIPNVPPLYTVYRTTLSSVKLPDGFTWAASNSMLVGPVGMRTFDAVYHFPNSTSTETVPVTVVVFPKNGDLCQIPVITSMAQAESIRITDGTYTLKKGTDYDVAVTEAGTTAIVTISFKGNYYSSVVRTFPLTVENAWTVPLSIKDWPQGTAPNAPVAQALYGAPVFTYEVNGVWQTSPPTQAGLYTVRAVVPATEYYPEISAEVSFRVLYGPPQVNALEATYGDILASIDLPDGYTWVLPMQSVGDAGVRTFAAMYTPQNDSEAGGEVELTVTVNPKDGNLCTISPIRNGYESKNIVITDGNVTLQRGKDYHVMTTMSGNLVNVAIEFIGNYYGTVTRSFAIQGANSWLVPLSIESWIEGSSPNAPVADSKYGQPVFTYLVNGNWQTAPPAAAGSYTVRAEVAATEYYAALTAEVPFRIYTAPEVPQDLTAVYGSTLASVALPETYVWEKPVAPVGNVGLRTHTAVHTPPDGREPELVGLQVEVTAKNGALCTISPITNSYESTHIRIHDGSELLAVGKDYSITSAVVENTVTVRITFIGNYYGEVERTFTFSFENVWIEPLSIEDWFEGQTPNKPAAAARYGTVSFYYAPASSPLEISSSVPETAGSYIVIAEVAQTPYYNGLSAQDSFEVLPRPVNVPEVAPIHTIYGTLLSSLSLPDGFTWAEGSPAYAGDVGTHTYQAVYQAAGAGSQRVPVTVIVTPRSGRLCHISPITDTYNASHIVITDGTQTLIKGQDYNVSSSVSGKVVTVTVTFTGNYYGTVTERFTISEENAWVVPLSIQNWVEGTAPSLPVAAAKYGTPVFSYNVNGSWQTEPPAAAGEYTVRAVVPASSYYAEISAERTFRILRGIPQLDNLTAVYGDTLSSVSLPAGYVWDNPGQPVGNVGAHAFSAMYTPSDPSQSGGPVQLNVTVEAKDGNLCTISPVTNDYEARHIVIQDGIHTLVSGRDYYVTGGVDGAAVTVTITFMGNYKGTVVRTFTIVGTNSWIVPLNLESWFYGDPPNTPVADAAYGEPVFSYLVNGNWQETPPTEPGGYNVRAVVAASPYYAELSMQKSFRIYEAPGNVYIPENLTAVYGSLVGSVELPAGFAWENPEDTVGNVGTRIHAAYYTSAEGQETVGLHVQVTPKDGTQCSVSPITNSYEAQHITVRDGTVTLEKGTDYLVTGALDGNRVTVTIHFTGNYTGIITRSYTFTFENIWTVPLALQGWAVGQIPNTPHAYARYGTASFSFASASDPLSVSRDVPTAAGDYIVYADVPATIYYNGLSASLAFSITEESSAAEPELVAAPQYNVQIETRSGIGKVLTGEALMITRTGYTAEQVLPMAEASADADKTAKEIITPEGAVLASGDIVCTGDCMRLVSSENPADLYDEAVIVVQGDVLGSGKMSIAQLVAICRAVTGAHPLRGAYLLAGDFNSNGSIDIADVMKAALLLQAEEL